MRRPCRVVVVVVVVVFVVVVSDMRRLQRFDIEYACEFWSADFAHRATHKPLNRQFTKGVLGSSGPGNQRFSAGDRQIPFEPVDGIIGSIDPST